MLFFAGRCVSTKSASGQGPFLISEHSELCEWALQAGVVWKYCYNFAVVLPSKNTTCFFSF